MVDEHQVLNLAYKFWEEEGRPEGKHLDHYFRAKKMLEDQASENVAPSRGERTSTAQKETQSPRTKGKRQKKNS